MKTSGAQHINERESSGGRAARGTRRLLVVSECALAVVLLAGAGLLIRSLIAVEAVDSGFHTADVLTAHLRVNTLLPRARRADLYRQAFERIEGLPGVEAAGGVTTMFWRGDEGKFAVRAVEGRPPEDRAQWSALTWSSVRGNYFQAIGVPLLQGRWFSREDSKDAPPVVLINETMARRYWPGENPIGKGIKGFDRRGRNDDWVRVIGVVKDVRSRGREQPAMAQIFETQQQSLDETENLVVRSAGGALLSAEDLRQAIRAVDKIALVSDVSTLRTEIRKQTSARRFQVYLLGVFALLALALAGAGIYGMMSYSVVQRTREIGIRLALGARAQDVVRTVLGEGLALVLAGVGLGAAGAFALMRGLSRLLFGVHPADPVTYLLVALVLMGIGLLACYLPARRVTRVDPVRALRSD